MLCDCLLGLDSFLSFCFGTSYANTTWDIRQALETGGYSGDEWPALYLKWEIVGSLQEAFSHRLLINRSMVNH